MRKMRSGTASNTFQVMDHIEMRHIHAGRSTSKRNCGNLSLIILFLKFLRLQEICEDFPEAAKLALSVEDATRIHIKKHGL